MAAAVRSMWFRFGRIAFKYSILLFGIGYLFAWVSSGYIGYDKGGILKTLIIYHSGDLLLNFRLMIWIFAETLMVMLAIDVFFNSQLKNIGNTMLRCNNQRGYFMYLCMQNMFYVTIQILSFYGGSVLYLICWRKSLPVNENYVFYSEQFSDFIMCLINYECSIIIILIWSIMAGMWLKKIVIGYAAVFAVQLIGIAVYGQAGLKVKYIPFIQGMFVVYQETFTSRNAFEFLILFLIGSIALLYIMYHRNIEKLL